MEPPRWKIITRSHYEHEWRALDFVREGLPDHDRVIIGLETETEMAGRHILVLQKAGDQTLASRLTKEGPCGMELLAYAHLPKQDDRELGLILEDIRSGQ